MKNELTDLFNNKPAVGETILLALELVWLALKKLNLGLLVKLKNLKQLITELLNLKKMDYFVAEYLDQLKIMNVCAANIKE